MAEYELLLSGVHYGANGDSVAGQKETDEKSVETRKPDILSSVEFALCNSATKSVSTYHER